MIVAPVEASPTKIAVENGSLKHIIYCVCILYIYIHIVIYTVSHYFMGLSKLAFQPLKKALFRTEHCGNPLESS